MQRMLDRGLPDLPDWVGDVPLVGSNIQHYWTSLAQGDSEVIAQLRKLAAPAGKVLLDIGLGIGQGLGLLALSILLAFFFYLGGENAVVWLRAGMLRIAGDKAEYLLQLAGNTVKGVVSGILGTALVQGVLAGIGYWIAGVPGAAVLGLVTFFLSVIPGGPALLWLPAALWLYHAGSLGWAIFIVVWGIAAVGTADNFIKPLLISKGSGDLPFILVMLGVLGGALAFGFLGVFIGPTLLAVAYAVMRDWTLGAQARADAEESVEAAAPLPRKQA
jgi:predicted PurR-regulated permease PerM